MKRVSIKRDIYLYLFGLVLSLTAIYGLMLNQSYQIGLNESAKYGFLYELSLAEQEYLAKGRTPARQSPTFQIYADLSKVPKHFTTAFEWANLEQGVIYEHFLPGDLETPGYYLYASIHYVEQNGHLLYVVSQYNEDVYLALFEQSPPESVDQFNSAFLLIGLLLLLIFVLIRFLIHRLTKPILVLSQWSQHLDLDDVEKIKQFRYAEIHQLAEQLVESVKSEREAVEREAFFLRAASHELRTPVSTISASNEMLTRLSGSMTQGGQRAIARINRSVITMQNLITTLLWMSRNQPTDVDVTPIDLEKTVNAIVDTHRYLADPDEVSITIQIESSLQSPTLPGVLVEIVITNLIRNALQHTAKGNIEITISSTEVQVVNSLNESERSSPETSFGIGLILISRLCQNQGWQFTHNSNTNDYLAKVSFSTETLSSTLVTKS